jgi:hypothetical protein
LIRCTPFAKQKVLRLGAASITDCGSVPTGIATPLHDFAVLGPVGPSAAAAAAGGPVGTVTVVVD